MVRYDALLLVSFGGPEGPDDVWPFLENVTRGRGVPRERLAEVAEHYLRFGGVSPLNGQNRALLAALREVVDLPVYWGNRNWHPLLADTIGQMAGDGVERALAFLTSAYSSYSSCRQYLDAIELARRAVGPTAPAISRVRPFFDAPGFVGPFVRSTRTALAQVPAGAHLLFTAHSVPLAMAAESGPAGGAYEAQLRCVAERVVEELGDPARPWRLVWQSRSGPPSVPWLEPDVLEALREAHTAGAPAVVLVPIGFTSDHMEVVYDLDVEARDLAGQLGLPLARARTPGTDPEFVGMVRDLVREGAVNDLGDDLADVPGYCSPRCCGGTRL